MLLNSAKVPIVHVSRNGKLIKLLRVRFLLEHDSVCTVSGTILLPLEWLPQLSRIELGNYPLSYLNCILMASLQTCTVTLFDCLFGCGERCNSSISQLDLLRCQAITIFITSLLQVRCIRCTWKSTLVRESYPRLTDNQPPSSCLLRLCRNKSQSCVVELLLENNARTTKKSSLNSTCGRICIIQMQMLQSWAGIGLVTSHLDITLLLLKTGLISCGTFLEVQVRFVVEVILSMSLWMPQCLPYWESWLTCQTPPCNQKPHLRLIHGCWDHKKDARWWGEDDYKASADILLQQTCMFYWLNFILMSLMPSYP